MREQIKSRLLEAQTAARVCASSINASAEEGTLKLQELERLLESYIRAKYRLEENECDDNELEALANASLAKALLLEPDLALKANAASTCDGASTVDMKQALLIVAIQKDLAIKLDGFDLAYAETIEDLSLLVWKALCVSHSSLRRKGSMP